MPKRPQKFKQRDVERAARAMRKAGFEVGGCEIGVDGKIRVFVGKTFDSSNEWDSVVQNETQEPPART